jgi:hypothetical protein
VRLDGEEKIHLKAGGSADGRRLVQLAAFEVFFRKWVFEKCVWPVCRRLGWLEAYVCVLCMWVRDGRETWHFFLPISISPMCLLSTQTVPHLTNHRHCFS